MTPSILPALPESIARAAALLRAGKLVAFPTETVYGLGADATNGKAVAAIFAAKGRPQFNPLIVHVVEVAALDALIEWNETARLLAGQFWPGPLTLVLRRRRDCPISLLVSTGLDTLAVRIPAHPAARELLREFGKPVAAPSANLSGKLSPTTPVHVAESLGDRVDLILAGGKSSVGVESTVVDVTGARPVILRHGGVTKEQLEKLVGRMEAKTGALADNVPHVSPGQMESHYAPDLPLRLDAESAAPDEALLAFGPDALVKGGAARLNLSENGDLNEAAANLFAMLRELDKPRFRSIAVMRIPENGLGAAINDRLKRASVR
jgi:L-threonylcarbamoyladenylate synthase